MKQREFLAEVGEQFAALTGGRAALVSCTEAGAPLGFLTLECALGDEKVRVRGSVFSPVVCVTASSLAVQITYLFDRRPRGYDPDSVTVLPLQRLEDLERLTIERVRRYGADVLGSTAGSLSDDSRLREAMRPFESRRKRDPATPA